MPDTLSRAARSERMSLIRSKDTKPELLVRRLVYSLGYRYRLHRRDLPGVPDLVFARSRSVIFVHGCFWHCHARCRKARTPKSRLSYWKPKLELNSKRDKKNVRTLLRDGWRVLIIWECQLGHRGRLEKRIVRFLESQD